MRSPDIALSKSKRKRLAETIADLVASTSLEVGEETTIRYDPQRGNWESWPKEIDDIFVARSEESYRQWAAPMGTVIPDLTPKLVQERIDEKEKRLKRYSTEYRSHWLLLVELGTRFSGEFKLEFSQDALSHLYQSSFDRILFLRYRRRLVFELDCETG